MPPTPLPGLTALPARRAKAFPYRTGSERAGRPMKRPLAYSFVSVGDRLPDKITVPVRPVAVRGAAGTAPLRQDRNAASSGLRFGPRSHGASRGQRGGAGIWLFVVPGRHCRGPSTAVGPSGDVSRGTTHCPATTAPSPWLFGCCAVCVEPSYPSRNWAQELVPHFVDRRNACGHRMWSMRKVRWTHGMSPT